jgi:hypothetical protein
MGQRQRHLLVQRDGRGVEVPCSGGSTQGSNIGGVAEQAVNTIACGTPDASGAFVATTLVCLLLLHTGLRTHRASGVPRALSIGGRDVSPQNSGAIAPREREAAPQLLPLFDIQIRTRPQSIASIVMHDASTSTASSLRRQGPITPWRS